MAAQDQPPPGGEGDCITQKAFCVISYLSGMDPSQQKLSEVRSSWTAGSGLGWAVGPASHGTLNGNCHGEATSIDFDFPAKHVIVNSGHARGEFDGTNGATLILIHC
ncbi:unnamed protein product [Parajaminaea phylloscopi]